MKLLYKFTKNRKETVNQEEKSLDAEGKEQIIIKKVEKEVPIKFGIRVPTRNIRDESEIYYNTVFGGAVRKGMIMRANLTKITFNDGSLWTVEEQKRLDELKDKLLKIQEEYTLIKLKKDEDLTEEDKTRLAQINVEFFDLSSELQKYETAQESLFNNTAENYAFNRYLIWYILNISGKLNDKDEFTPLFSGKTYEDKVTEHDNILESEDEFMKEVIRELTFLVTYWVRGKANTQEDFDRILKAIRDNI